EIVHAGGAAQVGELDADDERLLGESFPSYPPVGVPGEGPHVQLSWVELTRKPPVPPRAQLADDRHELQTGWRQSVFGTALALLSFDHPRVSQLAHARGEHGARDARGATLDLSEAAAPAQKLAHDEERPPL